MKFESKFNIGDEFYAVLCDMIDKTSDPINDPKSYVSNKRIVTSMEMENYDHDYMG